MRGSTGAARNRSRPADVRAEPPRETAGMPVIEVEQLSKRYGDVRAVEDVSFAVRRGEIFGILGRNGDRAAAVAAAYDRGLLRPGDSRR